MSFAISFSLLLLGLFVLPVLVSGCLPDGRGGGPWYGASRDPTGLAPDPGTTPEAVVQGYAARAVSWRGVFAVSTWVAVRPAPAQGYARLEGLAGFRLGAEGGLEANIRGLNSGLDAAVPPLKLPGIGRFGLPR